MIKNWDELSDCVRRDAPEFGALLQPDARPRSGPLPREDPQMCEGAEEEPTAAAPPVAPAPTRGAVVQQTPAEKIMELKGLLDAGAINQHEFDLKKAELLAKI